MTTIVTAPVGWTTIEELCDREFGARPSPTNLAALKSLEKERPEVRAFIERAFRLMAMGRFDPSDMSPVMAWAYAIVVPGLLPGAWAGVVPPWTFEDRHIVIDAYLARNPWGEFGPGTVLLEMGCGFPPQTAIDAARRFADWQVIGADIRFDPYVLYDANDLYACLDARGDVRFFHSRAHNLAAFIALYQNTSATFAHFRTLFNQLVGRFESADDGQCATVEHEGASLTRHPMRGYERPNLRLIEAGIGADLGRADIVRCFNVLFYFDGEFRRDAEAWACETLRPGGIFICGGDQSRTLDANYTVYRKEDGRLVPREFAFSLDNIRPLTIQAWYCIHDGDREATMLASLVSVLRSDEDFRTAFDRALDSLLAEKRIFLRDAKGHLVPAPDQQPATDWNPTREAINAELDKRGFVDRAVSVLTAAGYKAWRNPVGHIAIDPGVGRAVGE
jgi:hypothetical protein